MNDAMKVQIVGVSPILMHNAQLSNPLNPIVQEVARMSSAEKKTHGGMIALSNLHYYGGLYLDDKERPIVPGENIERMCIDAGRKFKKGKQVEAGVLCDGLWPLEFSPSLSKMPFEIGAIKGFIPVEKQDNEFRDVRMGRIPPRTGARVPITRPIFRDWKLSFTLNYAAMTINKDMLVSILEEAGRSTGLCDWRPKFGRFEVEGVNNV